MRNYSAALKALELMGKHLAMWKDKKENDGPVQFDGTIHIHPVSPRELSNEELLKIVQNG